MIFFLAVSFSSITSELLFSGVIYGNPFLIASWMIGVAAMIPGLMARGTENNAKRTTLMTAWAVLIAVFAVTVTAAGIYMAVEFQTNAGFIGAIETQVISKIRAENSDSEISKKLLDSGRSLANWAKHAMSAYIYKLLPFPWNAMYFLHWQIGLTVVLFVLVPAVLSFWAAFHAMGNRNYFATNPKAYQDVSIADGPEYASEDDEDDYESEESEESEKKPIAKVGKARDYAATSQATQIQSETRRGRKVIGNV